MGLPEASRAYAVSGWAGLRRVCRVITIAAFCSVAAFVAVVVIWGRLLLGLVYGPSFAHLQMVAVLIGCAFLVVALDIAPILVLKTTRATQHLFTVQIARCVVLLTTIAVLSMTDGIDGTAIATIIASAVATSGFRFVAHRVRTMDASAGPVDARAVLRADGSALRGTANPDASPIGGL